MQKTKIEIIDETIKYYNEHPRGINDNGTCLYLTSKGDMCAVGRCLINPSVEMFGTVGSLRISNDSYLDLEKELKPEYRGHSVSFWTELQHLHDNSDHWRDDKSLTLKGEGYVKLLKETYGDTK